MTKNQIVDTMRKSQKILEFGFHKAYAEGYKERGKAVEKLIMSFGQKQGFSYEMLLLANRNLDKENDK